MKKKNEEQGLPEIPPVTETSLQVIEPDSEYSFTSLFSRQVNGNKPVSNIKLKKTLTRPLIAMAHEKELLFTCKSEVYAMTLPSKSRGGVLSPVRVIDGVNVETAEECTLMLNELMCSSFKRGGYQSMDMPKGADTEDQLVIVPGDSIIGHSFAFREGIKREGAGYRAIDCVEVEVTY